jgi:hypothetical protein
VGKKAEEKLSEGNQQPLRDYQECQAGGAKYIEAVKYNTFCNTPSSAI